MDDKYLKYNLEDFLGDESFWEWAAFHQSDDKHPWSSWLTNLPENSEIIRQGADLVQSMKFKNAAVDHLENKIWDEIEQNINSSEPKRIGRSSIVLRILPYAAIAAGLALLIYFQFNTGNITISTDPGQTLVYELPDATSVQMNAASTIRFNPDKFLQDRKLVLEGEAFFDVQSGSPFQVETARGFVEVLGTEFNVKSRRDELEVEVFSGKVRVSTSDRSQSTELLPNQSAQIDNQSILTSRIMLGRESAVWLDGFFQYPEDTRLEEVLLDFETHFGVQFEVHDTLLSRNVSGLIMNSPADSALQALQFLSRLEFNKKGDKIVISSAE